VAATLAAVGGPGVVLSGSCSAATLQQVGEFSQSHPVASLDPEDLAKDMPGTVARLLDWARKATQAGPALVSASAPPDKVAAVQAKLGREAAGLLVEQAIAEIARGLVQSGIRRLVVAGGETSGAVVSALGVEALEIGPQIAPGVPATLSYGTPRLALALKSGNFGGPNFFSEALGALK
jgi:uncharacterized protein YgbK (DUF1537 family)